MKFITKIISRIGARIDVRRINRVISKGTYKYIHVLYHDKFSVPFVEFLNRNFPSSEHLVLCRKLSDHPFPKGENVFEIRRYKGLNLKTAKIEKIICHSLFDTKLVDFLYDNKILLKKAYWVIWGGDLYNAPRDDKNDFVRSNCKGWITDVDGDEKHASKKYHVDKPFVNAGYSFPITAEMIGRAKKKPRVYVQLQINNSCDWSTLEILDSLKRFSGENIRITTILSYGENSMCRQAILDRGYSLFGDNFKPIIDYMEPDEYANHMAQNDVLILNQNRQQGLGNSFAALALGVKLFIKKSITTYTYFNSRDIKVYDTDAIKGMISLSDLVSMPIDVCKKNKLKSKCFFDDAYLKTLWQFVFRRNV